MHATLTIKPCKTIIVSLFLCLTMTACSSNLLGPPKKNPRLGEEQISVVTGKAGGISFEEFNKSNNPEGSMPINALLWRAALDIASFVPLDDVDTFGGSIVTEWHQPKDTPNQRLKLTMFVIGRELRSDAITVRAYIQNRLGTEWVDAGRDEALGRKLEDLVLSRARELRATAAPETVD